MLYKHVTPLKMLDDSTKPFTPKKMFSIVIIYTPILNPVKRSHLALPFTNQTLLSTPWLSGSATAWQINELEFYYQ